MQKNIVNNDIQGLSKKLLKKIIGGTNATTTTTTTTTGVANRLTDDTADESTGGYDSSY